MSDSDIGRIKRNIAKMIEMGAPEADIDAYIAEEGVSLEQLQSKSTSKPQPQNPVGRKASGGGGKNNNVPVIGDGASVIRALFPGIVITDNKRDPNSDLGRANPGSWHTRSAAAVDVRPPEGMDYDTFIDTIRKAGFPIVESIDEVNNPSGHATGPHWHVVLGPQMEGYPPVFEQAEPEAAATPEEAAAEPEAQAAPPASAEPDLPWTQDVANYFEGSGGEALKGISSIVEGAADIPGMVVDPINTLIGRAMGYDSFTSDFGKKFRESIGLPANDGLAGDIIEGGTAGLSMAGLSRLGGRLATGALEKSLQQFGATPIKDTVAGSMAAVGAEAGGQAADAMDLGPTGEMIARTAGGVIGGAAGYKGADVPGAVKDIKTNRFVNKQAENNPYAKYDAEIVEDLKNLRDGTATSPTDTKGRSDITVKEVNALEGRYTSQFKSLINDLDLDPIHAKKLKSALEGKHALTADELFELRGTPAGDAIADSVTKVQRLRKLTPEVARDKSALGVASNVASTALDFVPGVPGIVGRSIRWTARNVDGSAEAARAHSAEKLVKRADAYKKLGVKVGPSGQRQSQKALWSAAEQKIQAQKAQAALDAEAKAAAAAEKASIPTAKDRKQFARDITDPAPDMRDVLDPVPTDAALARRISKREAALAKLEGKTSEWDAALADPSTAPKPVAPKEPTAKDLKTFRQEIADPTVDPREIAYPEARTPAQIASRVKARDAAIAKMENKATEWDEALADPSTAPKPKAPKVNADDVLVEESIRQGIKGTTGTRNAFKKNLGGIDDDQLDLVLDKVAKDFPDAAPDIERIRHGYGTKNKRFWSVAGGQMTKARDDLGIKPQAAATEAPTTATAKVVTPREVELQARLEQVDPVMATFDDGRVERLSDQGKQTPEEAAEATSIREELRKMSDIQRPQAYDASKNRRVGMGEEAVANLYGSLRPEVASAIKGLPEHAVHNIKVGDEALAAFDTDVMPRLQQAGATPEEIQATRNAYGNIATVKKHKNAQALDQGLYGSTYKP